MTHSAFHEGPFAPVTEEITAFDLPVTGSLPVELSGRYLRNGPNPIGLDDAEAHWFLGAGMVHGVRLRDGRAEWYRNRWVRSRDVAAALGETWAGGPEHDGRDFPANTHVLSHGGRTLATVESGPLPYELTDELDTVGAVRLRRHPAGRLRRAHQARPADRRPARDRLLLGLGPHPARRRRPRWHGRIDHRHPGQRRADDP